MWSKEFFLKMQILAVSTVILLFAIINYTNGYEQLASANFVFFLFFATLYILSFRIDYKKTIKFFLVFVNFVLFAFDDGFAGITHTYIVYIPLFAFYFLYFDSSERKYSYFFILLTTLLITVTNIRGTSLVEIDPESAISAPLFYFLYFIAAITTLLITVGYYVRNFETRLAEAINASELKSKIMARVAHDLRNPIGVMSNYSDLVDSNIYEKIVDIEETHLFVKEIKEAAKLSLEIVDDIIEAQKIEFGSVELDNLQVVDLRDLVKECNHRYNHKIKEKEIEVVVELTGYTPVYINRTKIYRAICNLMSNAIKFSVVGGKIIVSTGIDEHSMAYVSVKDNGIGIPEAKQSNLFQHFNKSGRTGTNGEVSTGLGLSIVKAMVELHNGTLNFESTEMVGSEFIIHLPLHKASNNSGSNSALKSNFKNYQIDNNNQLNAI